MSDLDSLYDREEGASRRKVLECMTWAGTGVLWTVAGGVPRSLGLLGEAHAADAPAGFTFVQISDSHIGFNKPANPERRRHAARRRSARSTALPAKPAFMIHTGDITPSVEGGGVRRRRPDHRQAPARRALRARASTTCIDDGAARPISTATARGTQGRRLVQLRPRRRALHRPRQRASTSRPAASAMLGAEQLDWLEDDLQGPLRRARRSSSSPTSRCGRSTPEWGWGTDDGAQALGYLKRFGSVTVLNGHIHQIMQKVEGNVTFHTARSTAFPQPAPGTAPSPGPMKVPTTSCARVLGISRASRSSAATSGSRSSTRRCRAEQDQTDRHGQCCIAVARARCTRAPCARAAILAGRQFRRLPRADGDGEDRQLHLRAADADREGRHHRDLGE